MTYSWITPFDDQFLGDRFGTLASYRKNAHRGTDWSPGEAKVIRAITAGKIENIFWSDGLGWVVVQSDATGKWFIGYCHLLEKPSSIKKGSVVKVGQPVGRVGNSGTLTTGPHLHVTLGKTVTSVVAGKVYDIYKHIKAVHAKEKKAAK